VSELDATDMPGASNGDAPAEVDAAAKHAVKWPWSRIVFGIFKLAANLFALFFALVLILGYQFHEKAFLMVEECMIGDY